MLFANLFHRSRKGSRPVNRPPYPRNRKKPGFLPRIEALEDRSLPSTFWVLNLADSGPGSLRQAVLDAEAHPGADTIRFAHGLHGTITLTSGELNITDGLTIAGPGEDRLTVSANHASRVFHVRGAATATLRDLTVADGAVVGVFAGAGILNEPGAALTLERVILSGNTATAPSSAVDVFGGGLLNQGRATVLSCTFRDNRAEGGGGPSFFGGSQGGAIDNYGGATLTVTDSRFADNQALGVGRGNFGIGGAIENNSGLDLAHPSTATINHCTFTGNRAGGPDALGNGGALDNEGTGALMTVSNCLVDDNLSGGSDSAGGPGGGIMNFSGSTFIVIDSTIRGNLSSAGTGGTLGNGGGIDNQLAAMTIIRSTIAGNRSVGGDGANGATTFGEGLGGGIMNINGGTMTVLDSQVTGNEAVGGANGTPTADQPLTDGGRGGGIDNLRNSSLAVINSRITGNVARGGASDAGLGGSADGGGIENAASTLTLTDCVLAGNAALGGGGGSGFRGGFAFGGGLENTSLPGAITQTVASVTGSTFRGNRAVGGMGGPGAQGGNGEGGGIDVGAAAVLFSDFTDASTLSLSDSVLTHNTAEGGRGGTGGNGGDGLGGGLAVQPTTSATVEDSTVQQNRAVGGEASDGGSVGQGMGGGAYLAVGSTARADGATVIAHNHASTSDDDVYGDLMGG
jgi:hypothetical protein